MSYIKWQLAERFGWTLDYINTLPIAKWHEWAQIQDAKNKLAETRAMKKKR